MVDNVYVGINAISKRCRLVGDKQVTVVNDERKQNIEQCKLVFLIDYLGDFFTVALTMSYYNLLFVFFSAFCFR